MHEAAKRTSSPPSLSGLIIDVVIQQAHYNELRIADTMECRQSIRKMLPGLFGAIVLSTASVVMLILVSGGLPMATKSATMPPTISCETETFQLYFNCNDEWAERFTPGGAPGDATPADPPSYVDTSKTLLAWLLVLGFLVGALFFVPVTLVIMSMATHAFRREPTLVISPTGLLDRRMARDEIPWSWIQEIKVGAVPPKTIWLVLEFRTGYEQMVRLTRYGKFWAWLKRRFPAVDQGGIPIDIGTLDVDPVQIGEHVQEIWNGRSREQIDG